MEIIVDLMGYSRDSSRYVNWYITTALRTLWNVWMTNFNHCTCHYMTELCRNRGETGSSILRVTSNGIGPCYIGSLVFKGKYCQLKCGRRLAVRGTSCSKLLFSLPIDIVCPVYYEFVGNVHVTLYVSVRLIIHTGCQISNTSER